MRRPARVLALLAATASLAACGGEAEEDRAPGRADSTRLAVEVTRAKPDPVFLALRCGGGKPCDGAGIDRLARALRDMDDPTRSCSLQYGGPERAHVTGTLEGRPVDVTLTRTNGCGIAGYDALFAAFGRKPLLSGGGSR
jgi:hypothetical protein